MDLCYSCSNCVMRFRSSVLFHEWNCVIRVRVLLCVSGVRFCFMNGIVLFVLEYCYAFLNSVVFHEWNCNQWQLPAILLFCQLTRIWNDEIQVKLAFQC